jgi:hypothetical protein
MTKIISITFMCILHEESNFVALSFSRDILLSY